MVLTDADASSEHFALATAREGGVGYVSLVVGNGAPAEKGDEEPEVFVIRVDGKRERGRVIVMEHPSPLAEEVHVRHSGDFAGRSDVYEFEWSMVQDEGGDSPGESAARRSIPSESPRSNAQLITGLDQFSDLWVKVRYRHRGEIKWGDWTEPGFVPGWLSRVAHGVNVFDSVLQNFRNAPPRTATNIVQQAGVRYRGAVPLNLDSVQKLGVIEVYETAYRRGRALSIDNAQPSGAITRSFRPSRAACPTSTFFSPTKLMPMRLIPPSSCTLKPPTKRLKLPHRNITPS